MAVEQEITEQVLSGAASFGAGAMDILIYIVLALCVAGLGYAIWYIMSFKHKVVVRYLTRNGSFVIEDKAKSIKSDGVIFWKFLKGKVLATPPPKRAVNVTKKGRLFAECYITEDNPEPVWIIDTGINKTSMDNKKAFKPVTTQQRALIVNRIRKAEARKGKNLWEQIQAVAIPAIMLTMVMIPFIFWGDITKTSTDALNKAEIVQDQNAKIAESNARILSVLAGKLDAGEIQVAQTPPDAPTIEEEGG